MLIAHGVRQRDDARCTHGFFAVHVGRRVDLRKPIVDRNDLQALRIFRDRHGIDFFVGEEALCRFQLLDGPVAVEDICKGKPAIFVRRGELHCGFLRKLGFIGREQPEHRAGDFPAVRIDLLTVDRAALDHIFKLNFCYSVRLDGYSFRLLRGVAIRRVLLSDGVSAGQQLFQQQLTGIIGGGRLIVVAARHAEGDSGNDAIFGHLLDLQVSALQDVGKPHFGRRVGRDRHGLRLL